MTTMTIIPQARDFRIKVDTALPTYETPEHNGHWMCMQIEGSTTRLIVHHAMGTSSYVHQGGRWFGLDPHGRPSYITPVHALPIERMLQQACRTGNKVW